MAIKLPALSYEQWKKCGKYFEWRDHNVFYHRGGRGEVLLTIHGFPTGGYDWCWVSPALIKRFHMLVPDLLDYGLTLNATQKACTISDQADMLEALMKYRGITEAHILAHDVGDTVVQELLARHTESSLSFCILSVVFLNGGMIPDLHRPRKAQLRLAGRFGPLFAHFISKKKFMAGLCQVFGKKTQPEGRVLDDLWDVTLGVNGRVALARRIRYMQERVENAARWVGAIRDAKLPMMLINGLADPVSGEHAANGWAKLVPKAKVARLPGIGHFPQIEAPETVVELVNQFHDCIVEKRPGDKDEKQA